jgi:hypothetical protein
MARRIDIAEEKEIAKNDPEKFCLIIGEKP